MPSHHNFSLTSGALVLVSVLAGCSAAEGGHGCAWHALSVTAAQADRKEYVGIGKTIELRLPNDRTDREPEVFPESPVRIKQAGGKASCEIPPGDVRVRNSIHLNADESRLLFLEYSGSNDSLVLYDIASCGKLAELDVSGAKWELKPEGLVVGTQCKDNALSSCAQTRTYDFGGECRVIQEKESAKK
jgi:hypothetical protein